MKKLIAFVLGLFAVTAVTIATPATAQEVHNSIVGVQGYDLVSYHISERPYRGNGNHVATHNGVNYLFATAENKTKFEKNPTKYLPAYGGYCAFGVSVGKKFIADPEIWEIVDGQLYMNLDNKIKGMWVKDIPGNIKKANINWKKIADKNPADL